MATIDLMGKHCADVAFSHHLNIVREERVVNLLVLKLNIGTRMCQQGKHVTLPCQNPQHLVKPWMEPDSA